jgi:MOSC domain-containing protein YiiM
MLGKRRLSAATAYRGPMPIVLSVNVGRATPTEYSSVGVTGIDKRPVSGPVALLDPGELGSGVAGDVVCDHRFHGGSDQAVYAYAREDLDVWAYELERRLLPGVFGENLTTSGLNVTGALIGERWQIGERCVLEVTAPRIPCSTFAAWLTERRWVRRFTERGMPGAYLRVLEAGSAAAGDRLEVIYRPPHEVTVALAFRAMTLEPELLGELWPAEPKLSASVRARLIRVLG